MAFGTNVKSHGARGDGATDDTAALSAAANAARQRTGILVFPSGTYPTTGTVDVSGLRVLGTGNVVVVGDGSGAVLSATGSVGVYTDLGADASRGDRSVTCSGLGASVGDLVKIISDAEFGEDGRVQGEMHKVVAVDGAVVTFSVPLFDDYAVADQARAAVVTPTRFETDGLIIQQSEGPTTSQGLFVEYADGPRIRITVRGAEEAAVRVEDCYAPVVDATVNDMASATTPTGYGVSLNNATMFARTYGTMLACRHAVAHGGNPAGGVCWESRVSVLGSADETVAPTAHVLDAHGSVGSVYWIDCVTVGGKHGMSSIARRNYVRNLTCVDPEVSGLQYAQYSGTPSQEVLDVDGMTVEGGTATYGVYIRSDIPTVKLKNIDADVTSAVVMYGDHGDGLDVTSWEHTHLWGTAPLIRVNDVDSVPSKLRLFGGGTRGTAGGNAVFVESGPTEVEVLGVGSEKAGRLVYATIAMSRISVADCRVGDVSNGAVVWANAGVGEVFISGGYYNFSASGYLVRSDGATLGFVGLVGVHGDGSLAGMVFNGVATTVLSHGGCETGGAPAYVGTEPIQLVGGSRKGAGSYLAGVLAGSGSPESTITANVGTAFMRTDGGAATTLYVKESGTGNTGWVAK